MAAKKEVDKKSKVLADLKVVPNLLPDNVKDLEMHEYVMLDMRYSLNPDTWMDTD